MRNAFQATERRSCMNILNHALQTMSPKLRASYGQQQRPLNDTNLMHYNFIHVCQLLSQSRPSFAVRMFAYWLPFGSSSWLLPRPFRGRLVSLVYVKTTRASISTSPASTCHLCQCQNSGKYRKNGRATNFSIFTEFE